QAEQATTTTTPAVRDMSRPEDVEREGMVSSSPPGIRPALILLGAALVALRDQRDRPHLCRVGDFIALGILRAAREDEQRLLVLATKRAADDASRCGNNAERIAIASDHLDARASGDVDASLRIN